METGCQSQLGRIDCLIKIVQSDDQSALAGALSFEDVVLLTCQCMWHLKDWIVNDEIFFAADIGTVKTDIYGEKSLMICADLANGSKHLVLRNPKTRFSFAEAKGAHIENSKGIYKIYYYIESSDLEDEFHWMEVRDFLTTARQAWQRVIDKHWYSKPLT